MVKRCVVSGCLSGQRASQNIKVAFFKAPKDIEMLRKWSSAINQQVKQTSFVCEFHFSADDVIKFSKALLKDGSMFIYEYEKPRLRKGSVPQLIINDKTESVQNIIDTVIIDDDLMVLNQTDISISGSIENSIMKDSDLVEISEPQEISIPGSIENSRMKDSDLVEISEPQEVSLDILERILETEPLRKNWCWTINKNSFISFSHINSKLELRCHVKIDCNLKVTITNTKTNIVIDADVNISSVDSVWQLLDSLENTFFCVGTGYDDKKCASTCTGILANETYKKKVLEPRCIYCWKLRRLIQKRKKMTNDSEAKWINAKYRLILERKKLKRAIQQKETLKNKLSVLKSELLALENQRTEVLKEVLSAKMPSL